MTEAPQSRTDTEPTAAVTVEPTPAARAQRAAAEAAGTIEGVHELGTPGGRALVRAMGRVPGGRTTYGPGVSVEVGQGKAALDVALVAEYGTPVPALADKVREAVRERVEREAELEVVEVNVTVLDVHHPDDDVAAAQRAEMAERARAKAQDVGGRAGDAAQDAADRAREVAQDAAERARGVAQDASDRIQDVAQDVADQAGEVAEDGRRQAADAVRDADDAVQRIAAQAAEAAAEQEAGAEEQSDRVAAPNSPRNDRDAPAVVLADGSGDGTGPEVVVTDQVVIADRVVVVDGQQDAQQQDQQDEQDQQEKDRTS